jgi:hypothetical protein
VTDNWFYFWNSKDGREPPAETKVERTGHDGLSDPLLFFRKQLRCTRSSLHLLRAQWLGDIALNHRENKTLRTGRYGRQEVRQADGDHASSLPN